MRTLYSIGILFYTFIIRLAALRSPKAKLWVLGRKDWISSLKKALKKNDKPVVWIHCSSLGEFEQGRPIIEKIREKQKDVFILLTFFSPSGYEIRKNYQAADYVSYLPADTPHNARLFISIAKPAIAIFIKYEFWYNFLHYLKKSRIPVWLVSGIFRKGQPFFNPIYGKCFRKQLLNFDHFFVQDETSARLLQSIGISNYTVSGDTRFDRVIQIAEQASSYETIERFCGNNFIIVAGSTWPAEEDFIARYLATLPRNAKIIIAPHEISEPHIQQIERKFNGSCIRYSSSIYQCSLENYNVLIIDNIGMLASLYRYGKIAIVGGGFGKGIHNVLEPTVYGIPVIFGPKYQKFPEACHLVDIGAGFPVCNYQIFEQTLNEIIQNTEKREHIKAKLAQYFASMRGSVDLILKRLDSMGR